MAEPKANASTIAHCLSLYHETEIILRGILFVLKKVGLLFTIMFIILYLTFFTYRTLLGEVGIRTKSRTSLISKRRNRQYFCH